MGVNVGVDVDVDLTWFALISLKAVSNTALGAVDEGQSSYAVYVMQTAHAPMKPSVMVHDVAAWIFSLVVMGSSMFSSAAAPSASAAALPAPSLGDSDIHRRGAAASRRPWLARRATAVAERPTAGGDESAR